MKIVIVDYGLGNLNSIRNMLNRIGFTADIADDPAEIGMADKLILPGVGTFDSGMKNIRERRFLDVLDRKVLKDKVPLLGICLGMQLLFERSEEGSLPGLGWIRGAVVKFRFEKDSPLKVPHMGWNNIKEAKLHPLCFGFSSDCRFYFVHSYYAQCADKPDVLLETFYGFEFTSAIQHENIMGTQFHPEKSHRFGMQLLKNFMEM